VGRVSINDVFTLFPGRFTTNAAIFLSATISCTKKAALVTRKKYTQCWSKNKTGLYKLLELKSPKLQLVLKRSCDKRYQKLRADVTWVSLGSWGV
jgi:hypothetical protein